MLIEDTAEIKLEETESGSARGSVVKGPEFAGGYNSRSCGR